ncbi:MAG: ABC transporter permease [Deltaproteobacteria bacterium]|nr:ABC transporter permease [Deltaproteobacteria bacterium]
MYLQIAWRNIWRNSRRTTVIMIAIIIGVWNMVFLGALMRGIVVAMVNNGISTLTGDIQVHQKGFRDDPVIENSIKNPELVENMLNNTLPSDARWASRVRVSAIANNARHSSSVTLVGIDPLREADISFIGSAAIQGSYLKPDDKNGIIVGQALVDKFETKLGYKLILMSQDTSLEIASRAFRISGIFKADLEFTEKKFVFVNMPVLQQMLKLQNGISEVSIILPDHQDALHVKNTLNAELPSNLEVNTWRELLPMLNAYLKIYDGFILIWYLVVFIAMGFGIVNTTLMAVFERMREFGLLKALGMKPGRIIAGVLTETLILLLIGMATGNILAFLCVYALSGSGIDLSAFAAGAEFAGMSRVIFPVISVWDLSAANLVVLVLGLLVSAYPAIKAARFTPVEALRHT